MSIYDEVLTDGMTLAGAPLGVGVYGASLTEALQAQGVPVPSLGLTLQVHITLHDAPAYQWMAGAVFGDLLQFAAIPSPALVAGVTISDLIEFDDSFNTVASAAVSEGLTVGETWLAAVGLFVQERVKFSETLLTQATYHTLLVQSLKFAESLANFWGVSWEDSVVLSSQFADTYLAGAGIVENLKLQALIDENTQLAFNVVYDENILFDDINLLNMIYQGDPIIENFKIGVGYVSPDGNFLTWVVNTRTNAVTQYQNWVFNSFATSGNKYLGANSQGLYELNGNDDDPTAISADIQGGLIQFAQGKLAGLKGVYIGMRGGGAEFYLKLIAGDGTIRTYQFNAQPEMITTKILVGKGLRVRYIQWELISTGPDFDIDTIEFVPMMSSRRV
jgi:hypothetical protein